VCGSDPVETDCHFISIVGSWRKKVRREIRGKFGLNTVGSGGESAAVSGDAEVVRVSPHDCDESAQP